MKKSKMGNLAQSAAIPLALLAYGCSAEVDGSASESAEQGATSACYVAFVHGKRNGKPTEAEVKAYWDPTPNDTASSFPQAAAVAPGCKHVLVRYDGTQHFVTAAKDVATQIASFVRANSIPSGQLVIVAHSMGGLVTRYILNNAVAQSFVHPDLGVVETATKYLITSQTPHFGSKGADVVAFEADGGLFGDAVSVVARVIEGRNDASDGMRRVELEYASTLGGFMNDVLRAKRIYTVEGFRVGADQGAAPATGPESANSAKLDLAWGSMCLKPHVVNGNTCPAVSGDGLVEMLSAAGRFPRSGTWDGTRAPGGGKPTNYSAESTAGALGACQQANFPSSLIACRQWTKNAPMLGAYTRWLSWGGDHQQGAWDAWSTHTQNYLTGTVSNNKLGTYIGKNGLSLAK